jgi:hypothetical protein
MSDNCFVIRMAQTEMKNDYVLKCKVIIKDEHSAAGVLARW